MLERASTPVNLWTVLGSDVSSFACCVPHTHGSAYEEMTKNAELSKGEGEVVLDHRPLAR
jgi:hypothetical protein